MFNPHKFVYWVWSLPFSLFMYLKEKQYKIAMLLLYPVQGPWASSFYFLDMLWRYWRCVAMQANHWRHPHFRWRYVLSLAVLLRIIMLQMCLKTRFIVKDYKILWENDFFSLYRWWQDCCNTELFFLGSSIYCAYRWIFKRNTAISMITIDKTKS